MWGETMCVMSWSRSVARRRQRRGRESDGGDDRGSLTARGRWRCLSENERERGEEVTQRSTRWYDKRMRS